MQYLVCSAYAAYQEAAAQAVAQRSAQALAQRGLFSHLRETWLGPTPEERWHYQQVAVYGAEAQRWGRGRLGEEVLFHTLGQALDDRHLLLLGYPSPQQHGNLDGVLVGPHGVTIYEVKAWTGTFLASDTEWRYWSRRAGVWEPARGGNPTRQVLGHVRAMRALLRQAGLGTVPVRAVIAIAADRMEVQVGASLSVPLLFLMRPGIPVQEVLGLQGAARELTPEVVQLVESALRAPLREVPPPPLPVLRKTTTQWNQEGLALYKAGQYAAALACYQQGLHLAPQDAVLHNNCGAALYGLQRYPEALAACTYALQLTPRLATAWNIQGNVLIALTRYQEALAAFEQALQCNPHLAEAYNGHGVALLKLGALEAALADLEYALGLDPRLAVAYHNKATVLTQLGRHGEAVQAEHQAQALGYAGVSARHPGTQP